MTEAEFKRELKASLENCWMLGKSGQQMGDYIDKVYNMNVSNLAKLRETGGLSDSKYPGGYLPKIDYWEGQLEIAVAENNLTSIDRCNEKLKYFRNKQANL